MSYDLEERGIAISLEGFASVAAVLGDPSRVARLWGAAERLLEEIGSPMPSNERARRDRSVVAARSIHGEVSAFEAAWQEGRAAALEQAMEIALQGPEK